MVRDLSRIEKYHLTQHQGFQSAPMPLKALVVLERGQPGEVAILERLKGVAAFKVVMGSLYRPELAKAFQEPQRLMHHATRLAEQVRVYRFRRPWVLHDMGALVSPLMAQIHEVEPNDI
ncbi:hypothetical protein [Halomonas sp. BC04]|uniref:hypothetical protein n=1 Tax=Halomonas sp. BC04 TaxID=1403540 RepID=UPI0003ED6040|nr:hypothetical protein [Halomonas sp. BC04]EWG98232.1 hypothetical protein Q427_31595 [Halomonas sp. BC04]